MWARFIDEYDRLVYPNSDMTWKHFFIVTSWIFVCPGLCLWCSPCACCKERNFSPLQKGAAAWLEIVNAELEPRGMYARFQVRAAPKSHNREWVNALNVFSIALTTQESDILRGEEHYIDFQPTACDSRMESRNVI